ncbi:MAG: purine-nucleoside phosphorylase [Melioribacteraceae bacterium]|nr:purine-nucleoside phosphorylase [Melioribacteraceae bacterium]
MVNLNAKYREIVESIKNQIPFEPEICIVLGSGLGDFAEKVETVKSFSTSELPGYPKSTVEGHQGFLHFSKYAGKKLLIVQGRIHFYEGYKLSECLIPIHLAAKLNCKNIILTNAAGGINTNFKPGDLMLISSFNGLSIKKELTEVLGLTTIDKRNDFLDFPSTELNEKIKLASLKEGIALREGVYWFTKGPSYETKAEIKMMQKFGGDAVGMSTFHEAVYASYLGLKVGAISCITNFAAGLSSTKLSHSEVMETAKHVKFDFERLVKKIIELI